MAGIKEREDGQRRGVGGAIIRERRLFYIFPAKGGRLSELGD